MPKKTETELYCNSFCQKCKKRLKLVGVYYKDYKYVCENCDLRRAHEVEVVRTGKVARDNAKAHKAIPGKERHG